MKKIVLFVAFVAFFCGSFVACACKKEQESPVPAVAETEGESSQTLATSAVVAEEVAQ